MLRNEQPFSVVLLDWVDIVVAEVSDATCTTPFPGMTTVILLCMTTHPSMVTYLSRLHIRMPSQQLRQWGQQK